MLIERYTTLFSEARHEIEKIKGSRFLGLAAPARTEDEAGELLTRARAEFHDARHHCWAWRLGPDGARFRSSDDGEPGGSAGRPILQQIEAAEITDTAVVVVRWFGGTKLGVGGLVRAYGAAARSVLESAEIRSVEVTAGLRLTFDYELLGSVQGLLAAFELAPARADYGAVVCFEVSVPVRRAAEFEERFRDATAARGICERS